MLAGSGKEEEEAKTERHGGGRRGRRHVGRLFPLKSYLNSCCHILNSNLNYILRKLKTLLFCTKILANGLPLPLPRSKSGELKREEESLGKEREEESSCEFFLTFFAGYG